MNLFAFWLFICIFGILTINFDLLKSQSNELIKITDEHHFGHNFCESRLQNNKGPEMFNAWSSLIMSFVPFIYGFPRYSLLYNVAGLLVANGFASFHYHYYLTYVGKQGDEIAMILANYFGLWALINMYFNKWSQNKYNRYNTAFMYIFIVANTLIKYDFMFPSIFGIYVSGTLIMIYRVGNKYNIPYVRNLVISGVGAGCWILSENYCNHYTKFGHVAWHCFFPLGFYKLILDFDSSKRYARFYKNNLNQPIRVASAGNLV